MQAVKNLCRVTPLVKPTIQPQRYMSAIPVPPRNKVSMAETVVLASTMVVCWSAIPIWVLTHIKHYRGLE